MNKKDLKTLAKIRKVCYDLENKGFPTWDGEMIIGDIEDLVDKCKVKNIAVKRIKEMIKEYYEKIGREVIEPVKEDEDIVLLRNITKEARKIKVPESYIVMEKLKDE